VEESREGQTELDEAAEFVAGTELKSELSELWQDVLNNYLQDEPEAEESISVTFSRRIYEEASSRASCLESAPSSSYQP
jgi:hypothetical protein